VVVSYLPLSHIAAQIYDLWTGIQWGAQVCFAESDALKVSLHPYCVGVQWASKGAPRCTLLSVGPARVSVGVVCTGVCGQILWVWWLPVRILLAAFAWSDPNDQTHRDMT
jgi:hypothetical protein